jgi:putative flippase GtrA
MPLLRQFARFLGVGAAMTVIGYALILALTQFAGMPPLASNFAAYAVLIAVSYWLHARITFEAKTSAPGLARYLGSFAIAYLANALVLLALLDRVHHAIAQLVAVATYALVHFAISRYYAFAAQGPGENL